MRKFLYLAVLSVVATLAFASGAMAQYAGPTDSTVDCSGAKENLVGPGYSENFLELHTSYVPDVGGCIIRVINGPIKDLNSTVYDPDTGQELGIVKDLDPDLTGGANSVTYQEFCGAFPTDFTSGLDTGITAQQYYDQEANAKEQAILDPDDDGQACTAEDEAFLAGDTGASEADNGADGGNGEQPGDGQQPGDGMNGQQPPQCIDGILDRNGDGRISPIEAAQADANATQGEEPCPGTGDGQQPGDGAGGTGADDETGSQFEQTWTGPITQTGEDGTVTDEYGVEADIMPVSDMTQGLVGEVVGEVSYDSFDCSGVWVLEEVNEDSVQVEEQIEEPVGNCLEFVPITLTPREDGSLEYYFESEINNDTGRGVLTRQGSSAPDGGINGQQPAPEDGEEPAPIVDRTGAVTEYVADSVRDFGAYSAGTMADTVAGIRQGRLPDTGGGWAVLLFSGTALVGGGWFLVRRFSR